jgi:hypothetical protein
VRRRDIVTELVKIADIGICIVSLVNRNAWRVCCMLDACGKVG